MSQAVPVHFAHNALVLGTSEDFRSAFASIAPGVTANIMKPGDTRLIQT